MALLLLTQGWIARTLKTLTVTFKAIITALIPILSKGFITLQQRRGVFFPLFLNIYKTKASAHHNPF